MQKIKDFLSTKIGQQIYSFIKTYITVFIGIIIFAHENGVDIFNFGFILSSASASFISVLRNIYKLLTEQKIQQ